MTEVTSIVYSEIKNNFSSSARQHKDSDEECTVCTGNASNIWDTPPVGHATGLTHATTFRSTCSHCDSYCSHCCLSILKGGKQDSYRAIGTKNVTENHNLGMTQYDVEKYMPMMTKTYEDIYTKFKADSNTKLLAAMKNHAFIVHGIKKNTSAGKITDGMIFTWEPMDGDTDEYKVSEIVYLHK